MHLEYNTETMVHKADVNVLYKPMRMREDVLNVFSCFANFPSTMSVLRILAMLNSREKEKQRTKFINENKIKLRTIFNGIHTINLFFFSHLPNYSVLQLKIHWF